MNLESLVSILSDASWTSNRDAQPAASQGRTFDDLLSPETRGNGKAAGREAAQRFVSDALVSLAHALRHGEIESQPIWDVLSGREDGEVSRAESTVDTVDATNVPRQGDTGFAEPGALLLLPASQPGGGQLKKSGSVRAALTATFLEVSRAAHQDTQAVALAPVPVVHVDSAEVLPALEQLLTRDSVNASAEGGRVLPAGPRASVSSMLARLGFDVGIEDGSRAELVEQLLRSVPRDGQRESLLFVPMRGFATGFLDQHSRIAASASTKVPGVPSERVTANASQALLAGKESAAPGATQRPVPAGEPLIRSASLPQVQARDGQGVRTAGPRADFLEALQGVLPPRQNFLLLESGERKRLFVRDFFAPADTLRRLGEMARNTLFGMGDVHVVINGEDYGSLR